jgi:hypothetical protein
MKDKKVIGKWISKIEGKRFKPSWVLKFHQVVDDALAHSIIEKEIENESLKKRVMELEVTISLNPLFVEPLAMMVYGVLENGWIKLQCQ